MIINKYDLVRLEIKEVNKKTINYPYGQDVIELNIGDNKYPLINEFLLDFEYKSLDEPFKFHKMKEKHKLNYEIKIIEHSKPTGLLAELIKENKILSNENVKLFEQKSNLELKEVNLKNELIKLQHEFKDQIAQLQKKAQTEINEHKLKNSEHLDSELKNAKQYALQKFLEEIINPLNNIEIAIKAALNMDNPGVKNFAIGFNMLYTQIDNILSDFGVSKIEPKINDTFNPELHQVFELKELSDFSKDAIVEIRNIGYKLHDRVIKPALVIVAK
ncbi:heat shock protein GrpE [Metamycoplasma cloacale]|uniref:Protein GrpE n=1 Tax=Metamycoplasma cloacale TaxID=92401 RepID=A0A2Z4LMK6_9BACT|nr:nucleotide exchange factor GrpE [Metamycoplasma cloacale]AWX42477.1 nucleotide exchange factor GrpE [Metamycoplasma cloacale]VEU79177.1 heat shock protein GrpE [Metamycoplasma cloacale]